MQNKVIKNKLQSKLYRIYILISTIGFPYDTACCFNPPMFLLTSGEALGQVVGEKLCVNMGTSSVTMPG